MKKILILAANPKGTTRLRLDQEVRDIEEGLRRSKCRDEFELIQRWAVRPRDIQRALLDDSPQIVHFSGHGEGKEGLAFEDEAGNSKLIDGEALANLFRLFADDIDCILLNGCYSQEQAKGIVQHIDYVIGMSRSIDDNSAIEFAVAFYDALGSGRSHEFAYKLACAAIQLNATLCSVSKDSRKLVPIDGQPSSLDDHTIPILLKRDDLLEVEEARNLLSGRKVEIATKSESLSVQKSRVRDLDILRQAGQERLEVLERQIALEENRFKENLDGQLKEALEWLKSNMEKLAQESSKYALSSSIHFSSDALSQEDREDFQWSIEKYIESVYYSILSNSISLLDDPAISPSLNSPEIYRDAFSYIREVTPNQFDRNIKDLMSRQFDYLFKKLDFA